MWRRQEKTNFDHVALASTPCDIDLSGRWTAGDFTHADNRVAHIVKIEQYGTAVFAKMQCKFASAAPLNIRGIVWEGRLVADLWRSEENCRGSGTLDLSILPASKRLEGTSRWYDAATNECSESIWEWERWAADQPDDTC